MFTCVYVVLAQLSNDDVCLRVYLPQLLNDDVCLRVYMVGYHSYLDLPPPAPGGAGVTQL